MEKTKITFWFCRSICGSKRPNLYFTMATNAMSSYFTAGQQLQRSPEGSRNGDSSVPPESFGRVNDMCPTSNCRSPGTGYGNHNPAFSPDYPGMSSFQTEMTIALCSAQNQARNGSDYRTSLHATSMQNNNYLYQPGVGHNSAAAQVQGRPGFRDLSATAEYLQNTSYGGTQCTRNPPTPTASVAPMYPWMTIVGESAMSFYL